MNVLTRHHLAPESREFASPHTFRQVNLPTGNKGASQPPYVAVDYGGYRYQEDFSAWPQIR